MRWILAAFVVAVLASLAVVVFALYDRRLEDRQLRRATGRLLVDQAMLVRHWEELESELEFAANYAHLLLPGRSSATHHTRFISVAGGNEAQKPADAFERELIDRFCQAGPSPKKPEADSADRIIATQKGRKEYQYYQAVRAEEHCLSICHRAVPAGPEFVPSAAGVDLREGTKFSNGDLMAVVQVTFPLGNGLP